MTRLNLFYSGSDALMCCLNPVIYIKEVEVDDVFESVRRTNGKNGFRLKFPQKVESLRHAATKENGLQFKDVDLVQERFKFSVENIDLTLAEPKFLFAAAVLDRDAWFSTALSAVRKVTPEAARRRAFDLRFF
ncbi:hypothetical protein L596_012945 [Steinernema carpocapsae]|uniref:Uncharacterized protein n=1 Tax=Steinernema carpocapsae TaxID=34508 RepID=A0A4U5NYK9_STECR|nr:hypothetical protein L596_012945 [Steinernema carpocapsae]